jgi:hypothetical protein
MKNILISFILTCLVSTLVGVLSTNFIAGFALSFFLQFTIFYIGNTLYNNYIITKIEEIKLDQIKELQKQHVTIACPCSEGNKQIVDIKIDSDIIYKCDRCDKNIKATHEVKNFITTQPIYFHDRTPKDNNRGQANIT